MSKVEELIEEIDKAPIDVMFGASMQGFLKNRLVTIQVEQEELQKKADKYDELMGLAVVANIPIDAIKPFNAKDIKLADYKQLQELSNQGTSTAKAAEEMIKLGEAFGDAMNRNKRTNDVAILLNEFLESDWDFHDESETEQGSMEYAEKIIELFEEQSKPIEVDKFISDWYKLHENDLEFGIWKYIYDYSDQDKETKFYRWFNNTDNKPIETLIRMKDGYTVKQEQLYYVKFPNLGYLIKARDTEHRFLNNAKLHDDRLQSNFTESEIKASDERYMAFAVKVEEEQG